MKKNKENKKFKNRFYRMGFMKEFGGIQNIVKVKAKNYKIDKEILETHKKLNKELDV